jgi:Uncharacterised nucleotidyltransferase
MQSVTLSPLETDIGGEAALLLCALRTTLNAASAAQLRPLVQQETDWPGLTGMALRHGVLPLLYTSLSTTCPEVLPQAALDQLRQHFHTNVQHNLFLAGTLLKLLRLLEAHDILAIPYKGPALATVAYGHLALRQFADLDLLVHPQDANRAKVLLFAHGYRWPHGRPPMRLPRLLKVYELLSVDRQVLVELHWALTSATFFCPLDPAPLWARLETVCLLETPVHSLAREDLLLILCIHGAKHHWSRLGWICDVAAVLRVSPQLDWGRCMAQASQCGGKRMLALGLYLAHGLLGASLPEAVERWIQTEAAVPWLAAQVRAELFAATASPPDAWDHPAFYLGLRERLRDRLPCYVYLVYRALLPAVLKNRIGRDQRLRARCAEP